MGGQVVMITGFVIVGISLLMMLVVNLILMMKKRKIRKEIAGEYGK